MATLEATRPGHIVGDPRDGLWPAPDTHCVQHGWLAAGRCHNRAVALGPVSRRTAARVVAGLITVATGLGTFALRQRSEGPATSYSGRSGLAAAIFVAAGLGLALAGLITSFSRPGPRIGDLALLAGFLWFAPAWVGWVPGPPVVRSLATVAAAFIFPVVVHLVLAFPSGRVRTKVASTLVWAVYVEAGTAALALSLFRDPFFDPGCWANCTENVFLIRSLPRLAHAIQLTDRWFVSAAAGALAAVCVWRMLTDSGPSRRTILPGAVSGMLLGASVIAHAIAVQRVPTEDPSDPIFFAIFLVGCGAMFLLAAGLGWVALRTRLQRRSVARIATSLGEAPTPGSLESALARAIGDPELRIAYRLPDSDRYVDANGRPVAEPAAVRGRALTAVVQDGRRIALVSHTAAIAELEREIGPAVRLGLENERLQAEVLARLQELRASRARIVETGDAERRRLERDLHDGAQQRLLALSYDIRLARSGAETDGDPATAALLAGAVGEAQVALGELRELAHGIYPAILGEAGLGPALASLADEAPLPVEIQGAAEGRFTAPVETAAYIVVAEALEDAVSRGARYAAVNAVRREGLLMVTVEDDGSERTSSMVHVADRVGAVGGSMWTDPTRIRAEIPCA
jgi:signal transduction histidine kinase